MSRITYNVPHPIQPPDGNPVYTKAQIFRAPNVAGVPGVFVLQATVLGSTSGRFFYRYEDDTAAGTLDDWYYHRYADTAVALFSDPSEQVQVDEYLAILWALADITDSDININDVTQWSDQAVVDLWPDIWVRYPSGAAERTAATIVPDDVLVAGTFDEHYPVPADLEEVCRVETIDPTTKRHRNWQFMGTEWEQEDREVRLFDPTDTYSYVMHGKRRFRDISELPEAFYQLIYWQIRKQYLDWRVNKRANTPRFLVFDRKSDTTPEQLRDFLTRAILEVDIRMAKLRPQDYSYDMSPGVAS